VMWTVSDVTHLAAKAAEGGVFNAAGMPRQYRVIFE
jgi:hypothetical protein